MTRIAAIALGGLALAGASHAQVIMEFSGRGWEDGGFPPSRAGEALSIVGVLEDIDEPLIWDPSNYSYTLWIRDFVSLGQTVSGTTTVTEYSGGLFTIDLDFLPSNHEYGVNPPNATVPSTFTDGISTYLEGTLDDLVISVESGTTSGTSVASLTPTGGDVYPLLPTDWIELRAELTRVEPHPGAHHDGYDFRMELQAIAYVYPLVGSEASWGGIKGLYR